MLSLALPATFAAATAEGAPLEPHTELLKDTGQFPNSRLPALLYRGALRAGRDLAAGFEELFEKHGWGNSWRNGLYRTHHYHSTAHEVLGVFRGSVKVRLGGPEGPLLELSAGDVAVIPAGVAHKNEGQSSDFSVVGAYADGTSPDLQYGQAGERPRTDRNIAAVALPKRDPVGGANGALLRLWRA